MFRCAAVAVGLVVVAIAGEQLPDAAIEKLLVGKWRHEDMNGLSNATTTFGADGTFVGEATAGTGDDAQKLHVTGKWKVSGGKLIETIETCKPPVMKVGMEFTDTVLEINDKTYRYRNEQGKEYVETRIAE